MTSRYKKKWNISVTTYWIIPINLNDQIIFYKSLKWRWSPMEDDHRCKDDLKLCRLWLMRGVLEETQRKSRVLLCSAQFVYEFLSVFLSGLQFVCMSVCLQVRISVHIASLQYTNIVWYWYFRILAYSAIIYNCTVSQYPKISISDNIRQELTISKNLW